MGAVVGLAAHEMLQGAEEPSLGSAQLPPGWHRCRRCGRAVPLREAWCSLCLWERQVAAKQGGWKYVQGGRLMRGRRSRAR
jgi:ribosomal protein L37E